MPVHGTLRNVVVKMTHGKLICGVLADEQTCVTCNLSGLDPGVGVLSLQKQLDSLDGGHHCFRNTSGGTTSCQISEKLHGIGFIGLDLGCSLVLNLNCLVLGVPSNILGLFLGCDQVRLGLVCFLGGRDEERLLSSIPAGSGVCLW